MTYQPFDSDAVHKVVVVDRACFFALHSTVLHRSWWP